MTSDEIAKARELVADVLESHFMRDDGPQDYCSQDSLNWPCDSNRLATALTAALDALERERKVSGSLRAYIRELP